VGVVAVVTGKNIYEGSSAACTSVGRYSSCHMDILTTTRRERENKVQKLCGVRLVGSSSGDALH
jgi:hypothetical protein